MEKLMSEQQAGDDTKVSNCKKQIAVSQARIKVSGQKIKYIGAGVDEKEDVLSAVVSEMKTIASGIKELDASVQDATAQRKTEHAEFADLTSSNHGAIELLKKAKDRLDQYYNPSSPAKLGLIVLPAWDGASSSSGSFVQISAHTQHSHEAAFAVVAYRKKQEESNRVLSMLDRLIEGLRKEVLVAKSEEDYSERDFVRMVKDTEARRGASTKALVEKESVKADAEDSILELKRSLTSEAQQKADTEQFASAIKTECAWLMSNYGVRKTAREAETKSLSDTKAVLAGADYSLAQKGQKALRGA